MNLIDSWFLHHTGRFQEARRTLLYKPHLNYRNFTTGLPQLYDSFVYRGLTWIGEAVRVDRHSNSLEREDWKMKLFKNPLLDTTSRHAVLSRGCLVGAALALLA